MVYFILVFILGMLAGAGICLREIKKFKKSHLELEKKNKSLTECIWGGIKEE